MLNRTLLLTLGSLTLAGAAQADFISADGVTDTSHFRNGPGSVELFPQALINGAGLDVISAAGIHSGAFGATQTAEGRDLWHAGVATAGDTTGVGTAAANVAGQQLDFSFDSAVDLTDIYIWQYSQDGQAANGRGVATFDLYVSSTAAGEDFVQVGGTNALAISLFDGTEAAQTFSLSASNVLRVRLDILTDQGSNTDNYVGLSEVHFEAVPEPGSLALLGLGGLALLRRRRA